MLNNILIADAARLITELIEAEKKFADLLHHAVDYCHLKTLSDHIILIKQKLHIQFPEQLHHISFNSPVPALEEVPQA